MTKKNIWVKKKDCKLSAVTACLGTQFFLKGGSREVWAEVLGETSAAEVVGRYIIKDSEWRIYLHFTQD